MKFFYNLKFSHKMSLLGLLMLITIAAPTWHLQKRLTEAVDFTQQEISGLPIADCRSYIAADGFGATTSWSK